MSQNRKRRRQMPRLKKSASNIEQPPLPWHAELLEQGTSHIPAQQKQKTGPQSTAATQTNRRVQKKLPAGTTRNIRRRTRNIADWMEANGPIDRDGACALYETFVEPMCDVTPYKATKHKDGTISVTGPNEPETLVLRSRESQDSFMGQLEGYVNYDDWDFDEERNLYNTINDPNS